MGVSSYLLYARGSEQMGGWVWVFVCEREGDDGV